MQIFNNPQFGEIRVLGTPNAPPYSVQWTYVRHLVIQMDVMLLLNTLMMMMSQNATPPILWVENSNLHTRC